VPLKVAGTASACISIAGYKHDVEFIVVSDLYHNVIFGIDSLHEMNAVIHRRNLREVRGVRVPPIFGAGGYRTPHFLGV